MQKAKRKVVLILKQILRKVSFSSKIYKPQQLMKTFSKKVPLIVVDVGATGGVEKRWRKIQELCHFVTFDPDTRAENVNSQNNTNFPIGLWSEKANKQLNLTSFPAASSIYPLHKDNLCSFLNASCHEVVDSKTIIVDTLQNLLKGKLNLSPDFIKVDAEGADLNILKGAENFLKTSCLGVQVEASFYERHKGAPFFSDIDAYLRKQGFILLDLSRERWIRSNNFVSACSRPQLIWSNVVYMLPINEFFKRFANGSKIEKDFIFQKFLLLLLVYQMHDYAEELRQKAVNQKWISEKVNLAAKKMIRKSMPSSFVYFSGLFWNVILAMGGLCSFFWFKPIRKLSLDFLKSQLRLFAQSILTCMRADPQHSCVTDED